MAEKKCTTSNYFVNVVGMVIWDIFEPNKIELGGVGSNISILLSILGINTTLYSVIGSKDFEFVKNVFKKFDIPTQFKIELGYNGRVIYREDGKINVKPGVSESLPKFPQPPLIIDTYYLRGRISFPYALTPCNAK